MRITPTREKKMTKKLIQTNALIDSDWVNYARRTIGDYGSKYSYYIHTESEAIEIGAGVYGRQTFILTFQELMKNF